MIVRKENTVDVLQSLLVIFLGKVRALVVMMKDLLFRIELLILHDTEEQISDTRGHLK